MNFHSRMLPTSMEYAFQEEGYYVWCGTMFKHQHMYYMVYSRWKRELGFQAWVTDSELCLAKAQTLLGKFCHVKVLFGNQDKATGQKICMHNPSVIKWKGSIYLYYMISRGHGDWWEHRNHQRIGVAYTDDPESNWTAIDKPVIDVSAEGVDSLMVSNPSVLVKEDGRILMLYKAVSKYGELPRGGPVLCATAEADHPLGPFKKHGVPVMENPENPKSVEDPYIWLEDGKYYALVKDFNGYFTKTKEKAVALFVSEDGKRWMPADHPLAFETVLNLDGRILPVERLERPQLFFENGECKLLLCACMQRKNDDITFNIRIPLHT